MTARVSLEDYARIKKLIDIEHQYKDVSSCLRDIIHNGLAGVQLDESCNKWIECEMERNIEKRATKRHTTVGFIRRIFGL